MAAPSPPAPPVTIADRSLQFNVPPFDGPSLRTVTLTTGAEAGKAGGVALPCNLTQGAASGDVGVKRTGIASNPETKFEAR